MSKKTPFYTKAQEIGNSVSHGAIAAVALAGIPVGTMFCYLHENKIVDAVGAGIFTISIFLMFLASCLYHSMPMDTAYKSVFRIFDHIFIYVAIAGTYTPVG